MGKDLWFQTNLNNDGGPVCRALRYRDDDKQLSEFVATLQSSGSVFLNVDVVDVKELTEIARQFNEVIYQFRETHQLLEGPG